RLKAWATGTAGYADDVLVAVLEATRTWFIVAVALAAATAILPLPPDPARLVYRVIVVVVLLQVAAWGHTAIGAILGRVTTTASGSTVTTATAIGFLVRVAFWSLLLLLLLDNLGFDVTAVVAGLGVGGIAVALALQNILGDLFASLAIALDKPVVYGDFVVIGDFMGTVERVGLKTTQLRSLSGEQIVIANGDLLSSRIRNYKRMQERRVVLGFGVTYETPPAALRRIPGLVKEIVTSQSPVRFDRAHLSGFGPSSLDFECVYFVLDPDFNLYMDVQQKIALALIERLAAEDVGFAYPTSRILLEQAGPGQGQ
ncbi:MAG: mechanosensitive ion channel family protein, partial [Gammaproteobacteria bacterium]|nr:mechanosensitive ion channel family protein [Gammaproteobacteria bacterium]